MTAISKNVYFDMLDDIFNKYSHTVHKTTKMKPIKVADHVRISKYKNIFAKGYTPNWSEEIFAVSKIKNTVLQTYVVSDFNGEEITGSFYEKELQKTSREKFRIEKVFKSTSNGKSILIVLTVGLIKKTLNKTF